MSAPDALPAARTPAPPSRRARKKAATRRQIYRAAMRLFRAHGFEGVTVEAICEAADVARRTFFLHFPTKAALLYEFNSQVADDFRAELHEPRGSAREELVRLVDMVGAGLAADAEVMGAMLREYFTTPLAQRAQETARDDIRELLVSIIERGQQRGEFRATLPAALVVAALLSTSSAILSGSVFPPDTRPEDARRWYFELIFDGILPRDGSPGSRAGGDDT